MTLHEAMVQVLEKRGSLSPTELAREINRLRLYTRGDGQPVPSSQISARANRYSNLFVRKAGRIGLFKKEVSIQKPRPKSVEASADVQPPENYASHVGNLIFRDLGPIENLIEHGLPHDKWLDQCGVYLILVPPEYESAYIDPEQAIAAGNVIRPWNVEKLEEKWVPGANIIYIGLAGRHSPRSLRARLRELLRHASGHTSDRGPHKGGEIIWQLRNYESFHIFVAATGDPPIPRQLESELLAQFMDVHGGALPFANRQK